MQYFVRITPTIEKKIKTAYSNLPYEEIKGRLKSQLGDDPTGEAVNYFPFTGQGLQTKSIFITTSVGDMILKPLYQVDEGDKYVRLIDLGIERLNR